MYLLVFSMLFIASLFSFAAKNHQKKIYFLFWIILTVMLCFRYGQGQDYFGYNWGFERYHTFADAIVNKSNIRSEVGFRLLCVLFNGNFSAMIIVVSLFEMCMLDRFVRKYSGNCVLSLLLFYPTIYLTYYFSALREGIAIAVFLGLLFELYEKKHMIAYIVITVIAATIHSVALILLAVPIVVKIKRENIYMFIIFSILVGIVLSMDTVNVLLLEIPYIGKKIVMYIDTSFNLVALSERIVMFSFIALMYEANKDKYETKEYKYLSHMYKLYAFGLCVYLVLIAFPLMSSRLCIIFKALEIVIIPNLIMLRSRYRKIILIGVMLISIVMTIKNISSYIDQGDYKDFVNVFNYPYITIFNKDRIWEYKNTQIYNELLD